MKDVVFWDYGRMPGSSEFVTQWSLTTNALLAMLCPPHLICTKTLRLMIRSLHVSHQNTAQHCFRRENVSASRAGW
eukprot:4235129-Ditylum_brightwellii.AAC.1